MVHVPLFTGFYLSQLIRRISEASTVDCGCDGLDVGIGSGAGRPAPVCCFDALQVGRWEVLGIRIVMLAIMKGVMYFMYTPEN